MALPFYNWSRTAGNNATADSTVNWQEGQAPSSINDSARAMMASTAAFRDDIAGAIVTAGTSTAYTVSSYQIFDTLAHLSGQIIAFSPHTTQTGTCTLNVDGLGAKPLRSAPSVELAPGTLIQGTPYIALYNSTDGAFYLHGIFGNPYNIPIAGAIDYWASTAPNSSFVFPIGQAISRTTYATLFSLISTTYGTGDGSTTFNLPDRRGRVPVAPDNGAGRITGSVFSSLGLSGTGGAQNQTLNTSNLPPYTPSGTVSTSVSSSATQIQSTANGGSGAFATNSVSGGTANLAGILGIALNSTFTGNAQGGTSVPFVTVQPSIICNSIMRII